MVDLIASAEVGEREDVMRLLHGLLIRIERLRTFTVDWVIVMRLLTHLLLPSSDVLSSSSLKRRMLYPIRLTDNQFPRSLLVGIRCFFKFGIR